MALNRSAVVFRGHSDLPMLLKVAHLPICCAALWSSQAAEMLQLQGVLERNSATRELFGMLQSYHKPQDAAAQPCCKLLPERCRLCTATLVCEGTMFAKRAAAVSGDAREHSANEQVGETGLQFPVAPLLCPRPWCLPLD